MSIHVSLVYIILSFVKSIDYLNLHHMPSLKIIKDQKIFFRYGSLFTLHIQQGQEAMGT